MHLFRTAIKRQVKKKTEQRHLCTNKYTDENTILLPWRIVVNDARVWIDCHALHSSEWELSRTHASSKSSAFSLLFLSTAACIPRR